MTDQNTKTFGPLIQSDNADQPTCPSCGGYNALICDHHQHEGEWIRRQVCRDCEWTRIEAAENESPPQPISFQVKADHVDPKWQVDQVITPDHGIDGSDFGVTLANFGTSRRYPTGEQAIGELLSANGCSFIRYTPLDDPTEFVEVTDEIGDCYSRHLTTAEAEASKQALQAQNRSSIEAQTWIEAMTIETVPATPDRLRFWANCKAREERNAS